MRVVVMAVAMAMRIFPHHRILHSRDDGSTYGDSTFHVGQGRGRDQHHRPEPNQFSTFKDFLETKPPVLRKLKSHYRQMNG